MSRLEALVARILLASMAGLFFAWAVVSDGAVFQHAFAALFFVAAAGALLVEGKKP